MLALRGLHVRLLGLLLPALLQGAIPEQAAPNLPARPTTAKPSLPPGSRPGRSRPPAPPALPSVRSPFLTGPDPLEDDPEDPLDPEVAPGGIEGPEVRSGPGRP